MKSSEILRSLADMLDAKQSAAKPLGSPGALNPKLLPKEPKKVEQSNSGLAKQPDDIFVPPLQLKIELLKKATGVENIYDENEENEGEAQHSYDELAAIKRNAGINPVTLDALGDDEPLDV